MHAATHTSLGGSLSVVSATSTPSRTGLDVAPERPYAAKRSTVSLYDTAGSHFQPDPVGPFEAGPVHDMATATQHFDSRREIKLKQTYGQPLPPSTYRWVQAWRQHS